VGGGDERSGMSDNVYSVSEIVGTSKEGVEPAIENALGRARQTLRNLDWFEVTEIRGHLDDDGEVLHYQVTLKLGFRME
jgi:flavin-binding protein dodecin